MIQSSRQLRTMGPWPVIGALLRHETAAWYGHTGHRSDVQAEP
jgi:hypothetical protein